MKSLIKSILFSFLNVSLNCASKEQGYDNLKYKLAEIVPDLTNQYSSFHIKGEYQTNKTRTQHAFQVKLALDAIKMLNKPEGDSVNIVDIGDSSGTHLSYLSHISGGRINASSVNLDSVAVEKVRDKGFEAILSRAEDLHNDPDFNKKTDIFRLFSA